MTTMHIGEVQLTLNDRPAVLRCTLTAAKQVNPLFGDYVTALQRIQRYDFAAYVAVIAAGTGKGTREVEVDVHAMGLPALTASLTDYLDRLSNGGRPSKDDSPRPQ